MKKILIISVLCFPLLAFAQFGDYEPPTITDSFLVCLEQSKDQAYCRGIFSSEQIQYEMKLKFPFLKEIPNIKKGIKDKGPKPKQTPVPISPFFVKTKKPPQYPCS